MVIFGKEEYIIYIIITMWKEMCDNMHISRSMEERLVYENDDGINYDYYTQRIIEDQEIYDNEDYAYTIDDRVSFIHVK